MARMASGTFGKYSKGNSRGHMSDEDAVDVAAETMLGMCGNPGQERLIGDRLADFYDWALEILESEGSTLGSSYEDFAGLVVEWNDGRLDKYEGTQYIWAQGWKIIAKQSGYHDAGDEAGEGAGEVFGGG